MTGLRRRNLPDIMTCALLFLLVGPLVGGASLLGWQALVSGEPDVLRAPVAVPLLGYPVGGPAALLTGAFAGLWLGRLHEVRAVAWIVVAGLATSAATWLVLGWAVPADVDPMSFDQASLLDRMLQSGALKVGAVGGVAALACTWLLRRWLGTGRATQTSNERAAADQEPSA